MSHFKTLRPIRNRVIQDEAANAFGGRPHPDSAPVFGTTENGTVHLAGWLMPRVSEVDPKTAAYWAKRASYGL